MKNLFFIVFILNYCTVYSQKPTFDIKYSEQLAVFVFLENQSDKYPENVFKTEFKKSRFNFIEYQQYILNFNKLALDFSYSFDSYPYGTKTPMQSKDILKKYLIETDNLKAFKLHSVGIIPNKTLNDLIEILTVFTPIYNELIYDPNKEKFQFQLLAIKNYAITNKIEDYFEAGLLFYDSSWDKSIPFEIAFYPLPDSNGFTAQAFYNNFISAIQTDLKDYKDLFSVMLHEIFHIIFNEQSVEVKSKNDIYFRENKSKCNNYAYQILNETLATAFGNGYVYGKLNGSLDSGEWYHQKYINSMAKQIYPLVKQYIDNNKHIDKQFIDNYINQYENNFPNWINELNNLMAYKFIISDNEKDFDIIEQKFPYRSSAEYEIGITENNLNLMQKTTLTKIVIVKKDSKEKLNLIKNHFKELYKWQFDEKKEFLYKTLLNDKSQLIIINQKNSALEDLIIN